MTHDFTAQKKNRAEGFTRTIPAQAVSEKKIRES